MEQVAEGAVDMCPVACSGPPLPSSARVEDVVTSATQSFECAMMEWCPMLIFVLDSNSGRSRTSIYLIDTLPAMAWCNKG